MVVPVYKGELTLPPLIRELRELVAPTTTQQSNRWRIAEVILVDDNGPDDSARVIRELAAEYSFVRPVWLSRNFGQHAATLAGMASSGSEWVVTLDEDGQHEPAQIASLLDAAISSGVPLVYGQPTNPPPHGPLRNTASRTAKWLAARLSGRSEALNYQSFRLITGELGRSVAAYAGAGVYLDVALEWVSPGSINAPVTLRAEGGRPSGYSVRNLLSHFWRLFLSGGTRGLRLVSVLGAFFTIAGILLAIYFVVMRFVDGTVPEGWTSLMTVLLIVSGAILFSLGVIAEYLGVAVNMAMGRPSYLVVSDPQNGPLGRRTSSTP